MSSNSSLSVARAVSPAWVEIDTDALSHNFQRVAQRLDAGVKSIASVKANAYGHGVVRCAKTLIEAGADMLATGDFEEAVALREAGIHAPILMFGGVLPAGLAALARFELIPTVHDLLGCEALSNASSEPVSVYVKVDCGLGRLGVGVDEALNFIGHISTLPHLRVAGIYTHLPFFDDVSMNRSVAGLTTFDGLLAALRGSGIQIPVAQGRASAAVLAGLADTSNAVCVGHLYYGLSPLARGEADMTEFQPVMRAVRGQLVQVATHLPGADVATGGHYGLANAMCIGVVPMGMAQGMRSAAPGGSATALIRGQRVDVLSVSLEHATLDLSNVEEPLVGEVVTFLGECGADRITLDEMSLWRASSPLEVAMTFSGKLPCRESC